MKSLSYYLVEVYSEDEKGRAHLNLVSINKSIPFADYERELLNLPLFANHTIQITDRIDLTYQASPEAIEII